MIETSVRSSTLWATAAAVAAVTFLVFSGALSHDFLNYDDDKYVTENPRIQSLSWESSVAFFTESRFRSYTPLTFLSHGIDYALWGMSPYGHHLTNLLLHSANAVWVFFLTMSLLAIWSGLAARPGLERASTRMPPSSWPLLVGGATAALSFSLHPAKVEAVAWVSDRKDLLMTFFLIPSFLAYMKFSLEERRGRRRGWYLLSLGCFLLAVLSKSVAVAAPLGLVAIDFILYRPAGVRRRLGPVVLAKIPFLLPGLLLGIAAAVTATGYGVTDFVAEMTPAEKMLFPFYTLVFYPAKVLVPVGLTPIYAPPSQIVLTIFAGAALAATGFALVDLWRGRVALAAAWLFYTAMILPTILGALSSTGMQAWADRYAYLPTISFFVLFGGVLWKIIERPAKRGQVAPAGPALIGTFLILGFFSLLSVRQVEPWRTSEELWGHVTRVAPELPLGYNNLGGLYSDRGDYERAIQLYRRAIEVKPHFVNAHNNLGLALFALGRVDEAVVAHGNALAIDSTYVDAHTSLGHILFSEGDWSGAAAHYRRALAVDSLSAKANYNLGLVWYRMGQKDSALACFLRTTLIDPDAARAYVGMGIIYQDEGRDEMSIAAFRKAARLGSGQARQLLTHKGLSW